MISIPSLPPVPHSVPRPWGGLLLATLLASPALLHAQTEALPLRLRWQPGKVYLQENITETLTGKATPGSPEQSLRVVQTTEIKTREEAASKNHLLDVTFTSIKGQIQAGTQTASFDSSQATPSNPMLQKAFGRAVGKTFTLVYDAEDRFLDVRNLSSLATEQGSMTSLSAMADSKDVAILFRKSMEMALPTDPVPPGGTWTSEETLLFPRTGEVRVKIHGKFASLEDREGRKHAKITFEGTFRTPPAGADKPIALTEITSDSTIGGTLWFDLERQVVSAGDYTSKIKLSSGGELFPLEQRVTTKMISITDQP